MDCSRLQFSGHALRQMFSRGISTADVQLAVATGKVIRHYADDTPYPSSLLLAFVASRPIHAVVARNEADRTCIVVTVYEPDPALWTDDFENRRLT
jgi:hypothetical protein